jgi:FixJ family two-component response regulator
MPGMKWPCICVLEDNALFRSVLVDLLAGKGFAVQGFSRLEDFQLMLAELLELGGPLPDIIVSDVLMEGGGGFELIEQLGVAGLNIPVILMSGSDEPGLDPRAREQGAHAFLRKPFETASLLDALERARADRAGEASSAD